MEISPVEEGERRKSMTLGPLEYLVVGFEGNRFTGQILAELRAAQDKGIIRVIDLYAIKKDEKGNVTELGLSDVSPEVSAELGPLDSGVLTDAEFEAAKQKILG
jgi:hypothetical protein